MARSRSNFSVCILLLVFLVSCASLDVIMLPTTDYESNVSSESVVDVDTDDVQEMTLMLKELLYPSELQQLYSFYGQDIQVDNPSAPVGDVVGAASDVTSLTLQHSTLWEEALVRGRAIETGLLILGSMFLIDRALVETAPDRNISGFYLDGLTELPDEQASLSISNVMANDSIRFFTSHLASLGYTFEGVAVCSDIGDEVLTQFFQTRSRANKADCPIQLSIDDIDVSLQNFYHFMFKLSDSNEVRTMEFFWPNKVIVEVYFNTLQVSKSSKDDTYFMFSAPGEWQINLFHAPLNLKGESYKNYQGLQRSAGTDFYRAFHYGLSVNVPGYFSFYRSKPNMRFHLSEGFYKESLYRLNESLTEDASIIRGRVEGFDENNIFISNLAQVKKTQ